MTISSNSDGVEFVLLAVVNIVLGFLKKFGTNSVYVQFVGRKLADSHSRYVWRC
jgi:hypothetical protein